MSSKVCTQLNVIFVLHKGVLLLQALTRSNGAIQKIVAFENAFERLLDIITDEGNSDGGKSERLSEDCFVVTHHRSSHLSFIAVYRLDYTMAAFARVWALKVSVKSS